MDTFVIYEDYLSIGSFCKFKDYKNIKEEKI